MRDHDDGENKPRDHIADDHLNKDDVAAVSQCRNADDRQRARFRRDNREADAPPGCIAAAEEIVTRVTLIFAEPHPERDDAAEVDEDNDPVNGVEILIHRFEAGYFWRSARWSSSFS